MNLPLKWDHYITEDAPVLEPILSHSFHALLFSRNSSWPSHALTYGWDRKLMLHCLPGTRAPGPLPQLCRAISVNQQHRLASCSILSTLRSMQCGLHQVCSPI